MEFNIRTMTGPGVAEAKRPHKKTGKWNLHDPAIWDLRVLGESSKKPLDCKVVDWPKSPEVVFQTAHSHDGTYYFTLAAVSTLSEFAEKYMNEHEGTWQASRVYICNSHRKDKFPHSYREELYLALKRLQ